MLERTSLDKLQLAIPSFNNFITNPYRAIKSGAGDCKAVALAAYALDPEGSLLLLQRESGPKDKSIFMHYLCIDQAAASVLHGIETIGSVPPIRRQPICDYYFGRYARITSPKLREALTQASGSMATTEFGFPGGVTASLEVLDPIEVLARSTKAPADEVSFDDLKAELLKKVER